MSLFDQALNLELGRSAEKPDDPEILRGIGTIYSDMGDIDLSNKYLRDALKAYERKLMVVDSAKRPMQRRSRPAWTYWIWNGTRSSQVKKLRLLLARAKTYKIMGE